MERNHEKARNRFVRNVEATIAFSFLVSENTAALVLDPIISTTATVWEAHGRIGFNEAAVINAPVSAVALCFGAELAVVVTALFLGVGIGRAAFFACLVVVHIHFVYNITLNSRTRTISYWLGFLLYVLELTQHYISTWFIWVISE